MQIEHSESLIMLYLIACALHEEKPDEDVLEGTDISQLFVLAERHSLSGIVYMALLETDALLGTNPIVAKQWKEKKEKAIRKSIMLDVERRQILAELEENHIWYMPLKGSVIKNLYPHEGMREMADNDILYDADFQNEVKNIFIRRGYREVFLTPQNHNTYQKRPLYNFEMHTSLFAHDESLEFADAFDDISNKFIKDEDSLYGRHLRNEDFYVYMTAHSFKHHDEAGTGVRSLVDYYVMNRNFAETMDWEYVSSQLSQIGLTQYELTCRNLSKHLFEHADLVDKDKLPQDEQEMLMKCTAGGVYGSWGNRVSKGIMKNSADGRSINGMAKIKYGLQRVFPGREWCRSYSPVCYKFPVFIPLMWIFRGIRAILFKRGKIRSEFKATIRCNTADSDK